MDTDLKCNNLSCRKTLVDKAVVVSTFHFNGVQGIDRCKTTCKFVVTADEVRSEDERLACILR